MLQRDRERGRARSGTGPCFSVIGERGRARSGTGPCFSVIGNAVGLVRERGLASA